MITIQQILPQHPLSDVQDNQGEIYVNSDLDSDEEDLNDESSEEIEVSPELLAEAHEIDDDVMDPMQRSRKRDHLFTDLDPI